MTFTSCVETPQTRSRHANEAIAPWEGGPERLTAVVRSILQELCKKVFLSNSLDGDCFALIHKTRRFARNDVTS